MQWRKENDAISNYRNVLAIITVLTFVAIATVAQTIPKPPPAPLDGNL
jgi:hypothetical protein